MMNFQPDRVVRFEDTNSESSHGEQPFISRDDLPPTERKTVASLVMEMVRRGLDKGTRGIQTLTGSVSFHSLDDKSLKNTGKYQRVLDPQGPFLQKWNKIFLTACVFAMAIDPLFFYIPIVNGVEKCLEFDVELEIIACVLRTITDLFYVLHIVFRFHTGFISPSSRVLGRGELIRDHGAIARRYLSSYFAVDILAVLPLPQVTFLFIIPRLGGRLVTTKFMLKLVILTQYLPRTIRIYPLLKDLTRTSGIITETAWAGAAFNLFLYMLASHVVGACWYILAIDRQDRCWRNSCEGPGCTRLSFHCASLVRNYRLNDSLCTLVDPDEIKSSSQVFNFGMFYDALRLEVVKSRNFPEKFFYCFWWGLKNLSSLGQNLKTSTFIGGNLFAAFICSFGLVLFSLLIGNMQKYLQSTTVRVEEMRVRRRDAEQWMSHRLLPEELKERIRRYEQYKWQETRGVDEDTLIRKLPKDLRRDIKRHLCLALLMRVPMFEKMDEKLIDAMCDRLKPVLYTENSSIVREGDPVNEMLFVMRGRLITMTTNGGRTGFFNSVYLEAGDFCGEELLTWALDPHSSSNLPISTRTVQSITAVEAFALMPEDLKFVASQFRRLHSKQLRHAFRFYSQQWKTWAACFIQAAWRRHCRPKLEMSLKEAEDRLHDALAKEAGSSAGLGATIYASRFASNLLRNIRQHDARNSRMSQRLSPILNLPKPAEPDFASEDA